MLLVRRCQCRSDPIKMKSTFIFSSGTFLEDVEGRFARGAPLTPDFGDPLDIRDLLKPGVAFRSRTVLPSDCWCQGNIRMIVSEGTRKCRVRKTERAAESRRQVHCSQKRKQVPRPVSHLCFGKGAFQEILEEGIHPRAQVLGLRSLQAEGMERRS